MAFAHPRNHQTFELNYEEARPEVLIPVSVIIDTDEPVKMWTLSVNGKVVKQSSQPPFEGSLWVEDPGEYLLESSAITDSGMERRAAPVRVQVVQQGARILLIEETTTQQSQFITQSLFEMGLAWDQVSIDRLNETDSASYDAVLWKHSIQYSQSDHPAIDHLLTWSRQGMPIYHMSPPWEVPQAPLPALETSVSWEALTGVTNINLSLSGIETDLQRSAENQRFWDGPYGLVQWLLPLSTHQAIDDKTSNQALIRHPANGGSAMIIRDSKPDEASGKMVLQLFAWVEGSEKTPQDLDDQSILFKNTLCWLIGCQPCENMDLSLSLLGSSADDLSASAWFFEGNIQHMGECPASSTFLDLTWNETLSFRSMQVESGWIEFLPGRLRWHVGELRGSQTYPYVLELAPQSDDDWFLSGILKSAQQDAIPMNNAILVGSEFSREASGLTPLRLFDGTTGLLMPSGESESLWELEGSYDLFHWTPISYHLPGMIYPLPISHSVSQTFRFFRIRR